MSVRPQFPKRNQEKILTKLREIPQHGRPVDLFRRHACTVCRRETGRLAWIISLGAVSCRGPECAVVMPGEVSKLFPTPYGRALDRSTLSIFTRTIRLPGQKIALTRDEITKHAVDLVEAYDRLLRWQEAYDHWEWYKNPQEYERGKVALIPPRRMEDVLVLRSRQGFLPRDPVHGLPQETAAVLRRVFREGPSALSAPF